MAFTQSRCTDHVVTVAPTDSGSQETKFITVSEIQPSVCAGKAVVVTAYDKVNGATTRFTSNPAGVVGAADSLDLSNNLSLNFGHDLVVLVTIDGWAIASVSTAPVPAALCQVTRGGGTCAATLLVGKVTTEEFWWHDHMYYSYSYFVLSYNVTSTAKNADWLVSIDLNDPLVSPIGAPKEIQWSGEHAQLSGRCVDQGILRLTGKTGNHKYSDSITLFDDTLWRNGTYEVC